MGIITESTFYVYIVNKSYTHTMYLDDDDMIKVIRLYSRHQYWLCVLAYHMTAQKIPTAYNL